MISCLHMYLTNVLHDIQIWWAITLGLGNYSHAIFSYVHNWKAQSENQPRSISIGLLFWRFHNRFQFPTCTVVIYRYNFDTVTVFPVFFSRSCLLSVCVCAQLLIDLRRFYNDHLISMHDKYCAIQIPINAYSASNLLNYTSKELFFTQLIIYYSVIGALYNSIIWPNEC